MKKLLFSFALLSCMYVGAIAQVKVNFNGYYGLDFKVKRCYVQGSDCIIDVLCTNHTKYDLNAYLCVGDGIFKTDLSAFDDEGNTYDTWDIRGTWGNKTFGGGTYAGTGRVNIPRDISTKLQFKIKNIDEFATNITCLICNFRELSDDVYGKATLQIKNIPITRE